MMLQNLEALFIIVGTLFGLYYENFSVEFVQRQANEVAHELAKAATLSASFQILVNILDCIEHILSNEML